MVVSARPRLRGFEVAGAGAAGFAALMAAGLFRLDAAGGRAWLTLLARGAAALLAALSAVAAEALWRARPWARRAALAVAAVYAAAAVPLCVGVYGAETV